MKRLRLWPHSLLGQMLMAVALALLVAQAISLALLVRAQDQRREEGLLNIVAFRLVMPERTTPRFPVNRVGRENQRLSIGLLHLRDFGPQAGDVRQADREAQLRSVLERQGFTVSGVKVYSRKLGEDRFVFDRLRARPRMEGEPPRRANDELLVAGVQFAEGGEWLVARVLVPGREPGTLGGIVGQTLVLYVVLVGGLGLLLRRITRPLAALTKRVGHFAATREIDGQLEPDGPDDTRRLIEAHNAMERRIASLLDEKDVMLGAIGHDLKTPLAALRVRIESVEDDAERKRMAATIEDITSTLDDILSLARVGRPSDPLELTDISALAAGVVDEFEDMGENVALEDGERLTLPVRATWLRRALRNLVGNALRYGGVARVSLLREGPQIVVRVDDDGQGIPEDEITAMLEPFMRGEASRNKATGGAGLGLTLARAIAEQHGGSLRVGNRRADDGTVSGFRAEILLPAA